MLCERDLDRGVTEPHGLAALGDDDLLLRRTKLLCDLGRERRTDHRRTGLSRDRADIRNMIEMRVRDENCRGRLHVGSREAELVASWRAVEIGIEQIDLALIGKFVVGIAEPADHHCFGVRRWQRPAGDSGGVARAGLWQLRGRRWRNKSERCAQNANRQKRYPKKCPHAFLPVVVHEPPLFS